MVAAIMNSAPPRRMGTASGLPALSRTLEPGPGACGHCALFVLLASGGSAPTAHLDSLSTESLFKGVHGCFQLAGTLVLLAGVAGYVALREADASRPAVDQPAMMA